VAQLNVLWLLLFNFLSFSFSPTVASHGVVSPSEFRIRQASQPIPAGNTVQINTTSTVAAKTIQNATPLVAAQPVQNATPAVVAAQTIQNAIPVLAPQTVQHTTPVVAAQTVQHATPVVAARALQMASTLQSRKILVQPLPCDMAIATTTSALSHLKLSSLPAIPQVNC
jgi:hypothetical protein